MYHTYGLFAIAKEDKMLNYLSTRNVKNSVKPSLAILNGIADDGGLYMPDNLELIKVDYQALMRLNYQAMAKIIFQKFFPDFSTFEIEKIVDKSYDHKFDNNLITPLVKVNESYVLELFHGPTGAFKDIALSALPLLMQRAMIKNKLDHDILIMTATSGDTGSAALHGFSNIPKIKIIAFYPKLGISEIQKRQMTTSSAQNTNACAINGNFDDIQNNVKKIFQQNPNAALSSANSINIGRLIPQIVYYFSAYQQLLAQQAITIGDQVNFIVPTGNFGDIMAGYLAKLMGLPINKLVCASNQNDVLTEFFNTGHYNKDRPFYQSISPSMDILISSNLERLLYLICGSDKTKQYLEELRDDHQYTINKTELAKLQTTFIAGQLNDQQTKLTIKDVYDQAHYLLDPHTAVAYGVYLANHDQLKHNINVVLATATPFKFNQVVLEALNIPCQNDEFINMEILAKKTNSAIPKSLSALVNQPIIHRDVIEIKEMATYVNQRMDQHE